MISPPKIVSFCVGTGRCGTTLISQLAGLEPAVAASHERLRLATNFHMFCKWQGIDIDPEGFLVGRQAAIDEDLKDHAVSFESSALLSHSLEELFARFDARFLLLVRRPDHTVASFAARGWFVEPIPYRDPTRPPSYPEGMEPRHFFGRNLPRGDEWTRWVGLSQIGRLAWFWQARNGGILAQFRRLPPDRCRILRLEDLDYDRYVEVGAFLGWQSALSRVRFDDLVTGKVNTGPHPPLGAERWSAAARDEFEREVARVAAALGYEHRLDRLATTAAVVGPRDGPALADVFAALDAPGP